MPFAAVRNQQLWYEDVGAGHALVLLHGFTGTARRHLGLQIDHFSRQYRVIAPDLRGYGRSLPKPRRFSHDFYRQDALDVAALLDVLGVDRAHVLGYSDGGETAVLVAIERPDLARSVVAWGVTGKLGPEILRMADGFLPVSGWSQTRADWLATMVVDQGEENVQAIVEGWVAAIKTMVAAGGDISLERAHQITCPVLLINGEHDEGNPEYLARQLAGRIPGACFEVWSELGHPVHQEAPERFNARVSAFVAPHDPI